MPQKELTPHQVSKGLSYVHKEPPFLARLQNKTQGREEAKKRFMNYEDGQDDDDYDELDGAQIVKLDSKGKEVYNDLTEKDDQEVGEEESEEPAVDENGRLLFRKKNKKVDTKRKLQDLINEEIKKIDPKKEKKKENKKKKTKHPSSLLSFQEED